MNSHEFIIRVFDELTGEELQARERGNPQGFGYFQNQARVGRVAEYCAKTWPGDLAEIGLLYGDTTMILARIARQYNRRVIGIDPFGVKGRGYGDNYYERFLKNISPWKDIVDVIKLSSLEPRAMELMKARPLCFAYVDGEHTYETCYSDILTVGHCKGIIAVDDVYIIGEPDCFLHQAFLDGATALNRTPMGRVLSREGYLIQGVP